MIKKKLHNGHILGAWQFDNGKGKGMFIGAQKADNGIFYDGVVMLLSDESGATHLVINKDKLEAMGGKIHIKDYDEPYEPCGIMG